MRRYMTILVLGTSLLLLFSTSLSYAEGGEDQVTLSNSPSVSVSLSNNTTVNVSYSEIFVGTSAGVVGASFGAQAWIITNTSSGYVYRSSFDLKPVAGSDSADLYKNVMNLSSQASLGNDSTPSLPVAVAVTVSHYKGPISVLNVTNSTTPKNASISNVSLSTLTLSFSIKFNLTGSEVANGNVNVVLVQTLRGSFNSKSLEESEVDTYEKNSSDLGGGVALLNNNTSDLRAVYWWNNNFTYNGKNGSDHAVLIPGDNSIQIGFVFKTNTTQGQYTLSQDPYLSVKGANLAGSTIQIYAQPVISFIMQYMEFFSVGIAAGSIAIVVMYRVHKNNKIKL